MAAAAILDLFEVKIAPLDAPSQKKQAKLYLLSTLNFHQI